MQANHYLLSRIALRRGVIVILRNDGRGHELLIAAYPLPRRESRTAGLLHRSETRHSDPRHVIVNRFHATAHQIGLMPESRSAGIFQELLPPLPVGLRTGPTLQAFQVSPVLPHAEMGWKQRPDEILVQQEAVRVLFP